jgi:hypothetical protein
LLGLIHHWPEVNGQLVAMATLPSEKESLILEWRLSGPLNLSGYIGEEKNPNSPTTICTLNVPIIASDFTG